MKNKDFTVTRHLPFTLFDAIVAEEKKIFEVMSVDHIMACDLTKRDKENMATREDAVFLFRVNRQRDLEQAGNTIDTMIENVLDAE